MFVFLDRKLFKAELFRKRIQILSAFFDFLVYFEIKPFFTQCWKIASPLYLRKFLIKFKSVTNFSLYNHLSSAGFQSKTTCSIAENC